MRPQGWLGPCGWQFRGLSQAWGYWEPRGSRGSRFQVILPTPVVGPLPAPAPTFQDGACGCFSEIRRHLQGVMLRHRSGPSRTSKLSFPMWPLGLGTATVPEGGTTFLPPPRTPQGVLPAFPCGPCPRALPGICPGPDCVTRRASHGPQPGAAELAAGEQSPRPGAQQGSVAPSGREIQAGDARPLKWRFWVSGSPVWGITAVLSPVPDPDGDDREAARGAEQEWEVTWWP